MTTNSDHEKTTRAKNVVVEVEETDDGVQVTVKGLGALKEIKKNLSSMGCCVPIAVACTGSAQEPAAD